MYSIETAGLTKIFGSLKAVDGLDLKIPQGSIYGFLGQNGAGKTSTIKMLTGLSKPNSGQIRICEEKVIFGKTDLKKIGYLPDVPKFYDWMDASETLNFFGQMYGIPNQELHKRTSDLLQLVGLENNRKKIKGYSRGMKQRLGIAQALINQPEVVFLDEPTSALDPIGRKEILDIIGQLGGRVTVFFSTHILSDVERICDRALILEKGKVILEGKLEELKENFASQRIYIETAQNENMSALIERIKKEKWLDKCEKLDHGLIIKVFDLKEAQLILPAIIADMKMGLSRFEIQEPSLEDIFVKVVRE